MDMNEELLNEARKRIDKLRDMYYARHGDNICKPFNNEHDLLVEVRKILLLAEPYCYTIRQDAKTVAGIPDLIVCMNGKFLALELKDNTGQLSEPQKKNIRAIVGAGGIAIELRTIEELFKALYACLE